ncbi:hypothetical protein OAL13_00175 [bacterium]|nr:hypothetical protein [bacterium]
MPRYDLSEMKAVKLLISPDTSQQIAELRSHFRSSGREQDSLAYVCAEAIALMHSQIFSVASRPADASHFTYTTPKE